MGGEYRLGTEGRHARTVKACRGLEGTACKGSTPIHARPGTRQACRGTTVEGLINRKALRIQRLDRRASEILHQPQAAPFGTLRSWDAPSPVSILFPPSTGVALTITHPMRNRRLRDKWRFRFQMQYDLYTYCTCREYNAGKSFQGLSVDAVRCSQSSK